jgi:uncharacterized membrane protein
MSTLEEQIDISVPARQAWEYLHRADVYPQFVNGISNAHVTGRNLTHLDADAGGRTWQFDAEITDRRPQEQMAWRTADDAVHLAGTFSLLPLDERHTRVQVRVEYEPETVRKTFGGPKGIAQSSAIERLVREDLQQFKTLVEQPR